LPEPVPEPPAASTSVKEESGIKSLKELQDNWPGLVEHCAVVQPTLRHLLRDSWPVALSSGNLKIGFDPEFAEDLDHARRLDPGSMRHFFQKVLGHSVHIEFCLLDHPVRWSHKAVKASAETEGDTSAEARGFDSESAGLNPQAWLRNQTVREVLEVFHGDIVEIQL
jgi:hypothetical protein